MGNFITPCKSVKKPGIYFDNFMLFDTHISEMNKKIYGIIMYINRIRDNFNKNTRIAVIQSLVLSFINYSIKVWGITNVSKNQGCKNSKTSLPKLR